VRLLPARSAKGGVVDFVVRFLAEKGGSRTLRGPYDPQTGFEDQRHHRAPSFSDSVFNYLRDAVLFCLPIRLSICDVPKVFATSAAWRSKYRWCICTLLEPLALLATSTEIPACRRATQPQHRACWQGLSDGLKRFAREAEHTRCPRGQLAAGAGYCSFLGGPRPAKMYGARHIAAEIHYALRMDQQVAKRPRNRL
jgi:hypothetical protein